MPVDAKAELLRYLQSARDAVVDKLDGLSPYDARRPRTPTGTNLAGVVKHLTWVEAGYLGVTFGRPYPGWDGYWASVEADPQADLWARPDEPVAQIVAGYRAVWVHSDATIAALPLSAAGVVPWWSTGGVTLHRVLVHLLAETERHAGHLDIVRELLDGKAGLRPGDTNLPDVDATWWADYREKLEQVARSAAD